jgi:sugar O-acyltransferase (sialic acid O-acetyltransferase NeuD family)
MGAQEQERKDKIVIGLYGAGGFGREVMPILQENIAAIRDLNPQKEIIAFFIETEPKNSFANGHEVVSEEYFYSVQCAERLFNVAIGNSRARETIAKRCIENGAKPLSVKSNRAIIYDHNEIGEGAILCANTMITSNSVIGAFFHANIYSYVAHDCVIGDFVTFAPNVHCNGNVRIGDHAYIGTGVVIREGSKAKPLTIGQGATVGMGAVVTKNVPPFTTVVGNPARPHPK